MWILFALLGVYTILYRPRALASTFTRPAFLAAYGLIVVGALIEFLHPNIGLSDPSSSYGEMLRLLQMVIGAVLVASLCRDKAALRSCMYGYLIAALCLSTFLIVTSYSAMSETTAANFGEASQVRAQVFASKTLRGNLNEMAFFSVQGFIVALVFHLKSREKYKRLIFIGLALLYFIAASLTLSRGGFLVAVLTAIIILIKHRAKYVRIVIAAIVIGTGTLVWSPHVLFSRLTFSTGLSEGRMEGRARVYTATLEHLPEYVVLGVGSGNFWHAWGYYHGFNNERITVGAHNYFTQVLIYWGVLGLLALLTLVGAAYKCVPRADLGKDGLLLCVYGIAVSLLLWMLCIHTFYGKEFSLGLGLLAGGSRWIWSLSSGFVSKLR